MMTAKHLLEDAISQWDIDLMLKVSGPMTLARHERDTAFYRSATIMRSGMVIERHREHFLAHRAGGPILAIEGDIGELLAALRDLGLL
ncbi:MAG: hypothetical protein FD119_488 [Stygiobacter sp.]|nr:MAG: hypothetical protein FD119_488 [Stygiobacter sp.]